MSSMRVIQSRNSDRLQVAFQAVLPTVSMAKEVVRLMIGF